MGAAGLQAGGRLRGRSLLGGAESPRVAGNAAAAWVLPTAP